MKVVRTISEYRSLPRGTVGFVPTMGALHEGHLSLMRKAKEENDTAVASIFVNPLQFAPHEDFHKYPRPESRDFELAEQAGIDIMFAPSVDELVPNRQTTITVSGVSTRWEGESRPGHFDGVATIVAKLFNIVQPDIAYFGQKDFQQCAVIRRMVDDLNFPIELSLCETVREADGLALSSRNVYLSSDHRKVANQIYKTILNISCQLTSKGVDANVEALLSEGKAMLAQSGFEVDYLAFVEAISLEPLGEYRPGSRIIVAARLGTTRLIDNIHVA